MPEPKTEKLSYAELLSVDAAKEATDESAAG
jgi:hypothetical protein